MLFHKLCTSMARWWGENILTPESLFFIGFPNVLTERFARDIAPAKRRGRRGRKCWLRVCAGARDL